MSRRKYLVPQVIQTSSMDCGPAALKCVFEGYRAEISYERLREYCQTDVDGTSVSMIEQAASALGIKCRQVLIHADSVTGELGGRPAFVVTKIGLGNHLTVVWRALRGVIQLMDPVQGRRWVTPATLRKSLYIHTTELPAATWRRWAGSPLRQRLLCERLMALGVPAAKGGALVDEAVRAEDWRRLAALDAAARVAHDLRTARGLRRRDSASVVADLAAAAYDNPRLVPPGYWTVRAAERAGMLEVRGALAIVIDGIEPNTGEEGLRGALRSRDATPLREVARLLRHERAALPLSVLVGIMFAVVGVGAEILILRALIELAGSLIGDEVRLLAALAVLVLWIGLLGLELALAKVLLGVGRRLELRLRLELADKILRLQDSYFRSRPRSDLIERAHALVYLRRLPLFVSSGVRVLLTLILCLIGASWVAPSSAGWAGILAAGSVAIPLLFRPLFNETDLRLRTHTGALGRFLIDGLLGLQALRAHRAERSLASEQEGLVVHWAKAAWRLLQLTVGAELVQMFFGFGAVAFAIYAYVGHEAGNERVLLLLYFLVSIPHLGRTLAELVFRYPLFRTISLRLSEPLVARESAAGPAGRPERSASPRRGVALCLRELSVLAGGKPLLSAVSLEISGGEHIAVVGASGAGKSTLLGLFLGWSERASGELLVDGEVIDGERLRQLRRETAWVDPGVQLWNRSLVENLRSVRSDADDSELTAAMTQAELTAMLEALPDADVSLGEGGRLVSGGQGQRVRLARALLHGGARLVLLDEPFRGLDRPCRERLLERARAFWSDSTLLCVTHDVASALSFSRVLVLHEGTIVEDGDPEGLAAQPASRFSKLLAAEREIRSLLLRGARWRRLRLEDGRLVEGGAGE